MSVKVYSDNGWTDIPVDGTASIYGGGEWHVITPDASMYFDGKYHRIGHAFMARSLTHSLSIPVEETSWREFTGHDAMIYDVPGTRWFMDGDTGTNRDAIYGNVNGQIAIGTENDFILGENDAKKAFFGSLYVRDKACVLTDMGNGTTIRSQAIPTRFISPDQTISEMAFTRKYGDWHRDSCGVHCISIGNTGRKTNLLNFSIDSDGKIFPRISGQDGITFRRIIGQYAESYDDAGKCPLVGGGTGYSAVRPEDTEITGVAYCIDDGGNVYSIGKNPSPQGEFHDIGYQTNHDETARRLMVIPLGVNARIMSFSLDSTGISHVGKSSFMHFGVSDSGELYAFKSDTPYCVKVLDGASSATGICGPDGSRAFVVMSDGRLLLTDGEEFTEVTDGCSSVCGWCCMTGDAFSGSVAFIRYGRICIVTPYAVVTSQYSSVQPVSFRHSFTWWSLNPSYLGSDASDIMAFGQTIWAVMTDGGICRFDGSWNYRRVNLGSNFRVVGLRTLSCEPFAIAENLES